MTRQELKTLTTAMDALKEGLPNTCLHYLRCLQLDAEHEFAIEERFWSEMDAEPMGEAA